MNKSALFPASLLPPEAHWIFPVELSVSLFANSEVHNFKVPWQCYWTRGLCWTDFTGRFRV